MQMVQRSRYYFMSGWKQIFEHGANTLRTFISEEQINFLEQIARTCSWESISREAVQMILSDHDEMIWWMQHLPLYYETDAQIFVMPV